MRIGIASLMQETNTFSVRPCRLEDFRRASGDEILPMVAGTNSELGGALAVLEQAGAEIVPLVYAWAMPSGRVTGEAFGTLRDALTSRLGGAGRLDGLVLSLHGSMAAEGVDDADGELLAAARSVIGRTPIAVSLDLHANVTRRMVDLADSISAYHTDPHVDMGDAGERAARRALSMAAGAPPPAVGYAKRPMIVPAETMNTSTGVLADIRREAEATAPEGFLEVGLFPVQPWLDVPELGFGVVALVDGSVPAGAAGAEEYAGSIAASVWERRESFRMDRFLPPREAIAAARAGTARPFIIAESADAPTAGAAGDSPAMVLALLDHGGGLVGYVPVVDPPAVAACHEAGPGARVDIRVGAALDDRWWEPVGVDGEVVGIGEGPYRLEGASFTSMEVSMGRWATVASGPVRLLLTEQAAWTSDPATFRTADLPPEAADVIVVRSCSDFRPNFPDAATEAVTLDVPGTATPRLEHLEFRATARPPYPLDPWSDLGN